VQGPVFLPTPFCMEERSLILALLALFLLLPSISAVARPTALTERATHKGHKQEYQVHPPHLQRHNQS
jgi:hypothetical protein